ncbi:M23 family metallopeptidase [Geosporobacter ferrireducens]|uniref:M23 family metallopeptidase n=1 Tax=Geosporobacter ferrireducens TaxID=1424294 RepID=UPI00139C14D3|nr:M23 family metallopeptidase [Geosporobacter ferrireducens]MTI53807.1 M23 family metallopeptidase [Geosporobacter ferrireducens]
MRDKNRSLMWIVPVIFIIIIVIIFTGNILNAMPILAVEELFSMAGSTNQEQIAWSKEVEDLHADLLEEQGISVHPKKVVAYALLENKSIPQDAIIKRKVWKKVSEGQHQEWLDTSSKPDRYEYTLNLWNETYPHRLFKQALVGIDVINETSDKEKDTVLLKQAEKKVDQDGLETVFDWSFKYTVDQDLENGETYYKIDDDSFQYEETIWESTYLRRIVTCNGAVVENTDEQTDYRYSYPLPYPNHISTMFKDYDFKYKRELQEDTGWIKSQPYPEKRSWTQTRVVTTTRTGKDGKKYTTSRTVTDHYTSTTWTETRRKVEKDVLDVVTTTDNYNFFSFLSNNRLDTDADPYLIYELAQVIPNNKPFLELLAEAMNIQPDTIYPSPGEDIDLGELVIPPGRFLRPLDSKYPITSKFGYRIHPTLKDRRFHNGIDIGAPMNTPVHAAAAGKVIYAGGMGSYGNLLIIQHTEEGYQGFETYYAHLNKFYVKKGDMVKTGQVVAAVGSTGRSTGPHLHFEIRYQGKAIDPQPIIN